MVMMVSVPERPSTPSEQFVTLIDTQTKMTVEYSKHNRWNIYRAAKYGKGDCA